MKEDEEPSWPGQVFANLELNYQEAMQAYVAATRDRLSLTRAEKVVKGGRKSEKQALWRADQALREERYQVRERRKEEDAIWRAFRKQFVLEKEAFRALPKAERRKQRQAREALEQSWLTGSNVGQACRFVPKKILIGEPYAYNCGAVPLKN